MAVNIADIQYNNSVLHKSLNDNGYICSTDFTDKVLTSINAKPVSGAFLYGMAGTGKSYLPMVLAKVLERQLFVHQCTQGTREEDLLVKIMPSEDTTSGVKIGKGKILQAAIESQTRPVMLMLDEWDKTRPSVDGFFLDFLQYGRLSLPGVKGGEVQANLDNLTIFITANDEREFHEALLRRFPMIHVEPIEPVDVVNALSLTHEDNPYMPQMIDLYTRSVAAKLPKPATIQELRQLMDAIDILGSRADWDALVNQYITKTPENHILLANQEKIEKLDESTLKKIKADDYGVDVVLPKEKNEEPTMPGLRDLAEFDDSFEKANKVPDNATFIYCNSDDKQSPIHDVVARDLVMSDNINNDDPELASMPDWGTITDNITCLNGDFNSHHLLLLDKTKYFKNLDGEVKIVDKYITRKEVSRMLAGKWYIHKRNKDEIIARLIGCIDEKPIDLRYRKGKGIEVISPTKNVELSGLFKLNKTENLTRNRYIDEFLTDNHNIKYYNSTELVVPSLWTLIVEGNNLCIGNSGIKSLSTHANDKYCNGIWLTAPNGKAYCSFESIPMITDVIKNNKTKYKIETDDDGFSINSNNLEFYASGFTGDNNSYMTLSIDGYVHPQPLKYLLNWISCIPIYKCFKHDGNIRETLTKAGWELYHKSNNTYLKNGIYAHIVYDYVLFCGFIQQHSAIDEPTLSLEMKTKINRIKALEKAHNTIKD